VTIGALSPAQIESLLDRATVGRIGVANADHVYVVPMTYVYDGDSIYGHTTLGQKVRMMRTNPQVCFEVDDIKDMANWRSVVAQGRFEELTGDLAVAAERLIAARLGPLTTSETAGPSGPTKDRKQHVAFRIKLRERTGRFERRRKGGKRG
jgi:nitroimidazol reductase NimA-like FMN-containing flavoprotein (pyridoxamine 5'-phosphate oxidase superfamily)